MKRYERTNERAKRGGKEKEVTKSSKILCMSACVCARVVCTVRLYEYNHHHIFFFLVTDPRPSVYPLCVSLEVVRISSNNHLCCCPSGGWYLFADRRPPPHVAPRLVPLLPLQLSRGSFGIYYLHVLHVSVSQSRGKVR